ncbi:MAG: DUF4212 domain-containing protein [Nitrospirales bacterium]
MSNTPSRQPRQKTNQANRAHAHWHDNLRLMSILLAIWFVVSYLLGIVFVEPLNQFHLGGFPLGFWFAQQGSIFTFIILIFVYAILMDRVDQRHGVNDNPTSRPTQNSSEMPE